MMGDNSRPLPVEISRTSARKAPSVESGVALRRKATPNDI